MKEVCIFGSGKTNWLWDYRCETWGVNFTYITALSLDKLFFTDEASEVQKHEYQRLDLLKRLQPTLVFPIVYPKFKDFGLPIEIYPIEKIIKKFGTKYFCNSIAYMIAYALYYGYKKIYLYGVDFDEADWDRQRQKQQEERGDEFWMGVALGMGVDVITPIESNIGKTFDRRMYGEFRNAVL